MKWPFYLIAAVVLGGGLGSYMLFSSPTAVLGIVGAVAMAAWPHLKDYLDVSPETLKKRDEDLNSNSHRGITGQDRDSRH